MIYEAQKKSESNDLTLGKVIPRWLQLREDLVALIPIVPALESFVNTEFKARFEI